MRRLTWTVVLLAVTGALGAPRVSAADAIDEAIAKIKADEKAGDAKSVAALVKDLAEHDDPRVHALLHGLTGARDDSIARAAYEQIGAHKDASFLVQMRSRAEDKSLAKERPEVYSALLDAFVALADDGKATHEVMDGLVQKYLPTNAEFSVRAIRAFAALRDKSTVDKLIVWIMQCDMASAPLANKTGMGVITPEMKACLEKARPVILECLKSLTGEALATGDEWRKWWKDKKANFKCPPAPAAK